MSRSQWRDVPLADCVVSVSAGVSVNSEDRPAGPGEVGILKTSAVSGGYFRAGQNKVVIAVDRNRVSEPVQTGSVLFSRMNTPMLVGDSCYVPIGDPLLFLPDRLWQLRTASATVDPQWLAYALQSGRAISAIRALATGTSGSMKNIAKRGLLALKVPLPPYAEQRNIVAVLAMLDECIRSTEQVLAKLRMLHEALLLRAFSASSDTAAHLGDLVSAERPVVYGILMPGQHVPNGVPVVKVKDMKSGRISRDELLCTSSAIDQEYRRSRLKSGDVLLSIRGTVGRVCIVPPELDNANITQDTARIAVPPSIARYVAHYLTSPSAQRFIESETVGLAVRGINLRDVRRVRVPVVTEDLVISITNHLDASEELIEREELQLSKLSKLKIGLMADLLSGHVRVPHGVVS